MGTDPILRGDYSKAGLDYSVEQDWSAYTPAEHALYRRLFERQSKLVPRYACNEWIDAIAGLDSAREIPRFDKVSRQLKAKTGWEIVAVPGLIPDDAFFTHLANRRFPVTVWLRRPEEFAYIVEPDVFHDFFGHVPLLFDRTYADHLYEYGKGGLKAMRLDAVKMLFWSAVTNGVLAPPLIALLVLLTSDTKVMGERVNSPLLRWLGWITAAVMAVAAVAMFIAG